MRKAIIIPAWFEPLHPSGWRFHWGDDSWTRMKLTQEEFLFLYDDRPANFLLSYLPGPWPGLR